MYEDDREFYYCYSHRLFHFLKVERGLRYICSGLNENTSAKFWLFRRTPELLAALADYSSLVPTG